MKNVILWLFSFSLIMSLSQCNPEECTYPETELIIPDVIIPEQVESTPGPLDEIMEVLLNQPPNNGDPMTRSMP